MKSRSLRFWLLGSHAVVLVLPVVALFATGALAMDLRKQTKAELLVQGAILALWVETELRDEPDSQAWLQTHTGDVSRFLAETKHRTLSGIRLLDENGRVVASSGTTDGEDLSKEPEVAVALQGEQGEAVRPREPEADYALGGPSRAADVRMFVAHPVFVGERVVAVVLLSRTPWGEVQAIYQMAPRLVLGGLAAFLITVGLAISAGHVGTRSLKRLAKASHHLAEGSFEVEADLDRAARSRVREVAEVADAMKGMKDRLEARLRYITEFASAVSHEFKTPLSTLRGTMELLEDDDGMPPEQRTRFLENALTDVHRLDRLVHGLLELARAEEDPSTETVVLDEVLAQLARDEGVAFQKGAGAVQGSATQLETVARNLVDNARRHGKASTIEIVGWQDEGATGFDVIDDGTGISEANQGQVFDRFFTTDRAGGGTGIGLALVRTIVRTHGGEVHLESRAGRTRFRVSLPRRGAAQLDS